MRITTFGLLLVANFTFAQRGYNIIESNPIWISENYQTEAMQPWGEITNAGAAFEANSNFSTNPTDNTRDYRFDYQITSHIVAPGFSGEVTYLVNSADNSIAIPFDNQVNAALRNLLIAKHPDYIGLHFLIRKADRNLLVCGLYKNPKTGTPEKRGMDVGKNMPINDVLGEEIWSQMYWFNRAETLNSEDVGESGASPQMMEIIENVPIEGLRGERPEGGKLDMYFVKLPLMEKISVPFMGFGNGIVKNLKTRTNQLVVWMAVRDVPWKGNTTNLFFYLQKMYKVNAVFHPGNYAVATLFNKEGMQDTQQFQAYVMQKLQEVKRLQNLAKDCPQGNKGKECRTQYEKQVRQIQKELEDKAKELGEKHHIPMN